jgi:glycosyltransferase involved in cell wall biosynthesis
MRICYVVHSASHFAAPYVDYFARNGHEAHVISFSQEPLANAVNHHPVAREYDPTGNKLDYVRAIPAVRRLVRRIAPDLLHAHYLTSNGMVAAATGFHPLVVSARGSDVHDSMRSPWRRALVRMVMNRADLVNPVSRELAAKVASLGVPAGKTLCLTQGIDTARFVVPRRSRAPGRVTMICTRKLHRPYQPATIVEALALIAARGLDFHFTFAATGRDQAMVRRMVAERRLGARVGFLGGYLPEQLPGLLAEQDIYVSASLWDGTSPALLEAMAAGAYPVVTDCPANREWLQGDGDGLLFAPDDIAGLAACLLTAATRSGLWEAAAVRNRRIVIERADRETNMRIMAANYDRLVEEFSRGGRPGVRLGSYTVPRAPTVSIDSRERAAG